MLKLIIEYFSFFLLSSFFTGSSLELTEQTETAEILLDVDLWLKIEKTLAGFIYSYNDINLYQLLYKGGHVLWGFKTGGIARGILINVNPNTGFMISFKLNFCFLERPLLSTKRPVGEGCFDGVSV